jgi:capsule polysaccharide export protein KpsE/RkpR
MNRMLSLLSVILRRKWTVIIVTMTGFIVSVVISLVLPPKYISHAAFIPGGVEREITGTGSFLSRLGLMGEEYATLVRVQRNFIIDYIIRSRRMSRLMDERFNLGEVYGTGGEEETRKKLNERIHVEVRDEGVIELAIEARTPELARDMTAACLGFADSFLVEMVLSNASSRRDFLTEELERRKARIAGIDSMLGVFMKTHDVFDIEHQAKAAFEIIGILSARMSVLEVERRMMEISVSEDMPELERINLEIEMLRKQLLSVREGEGGQGLFPPLSDFPDLAAEYLGLISERMAQEFALAFIGLKLSDATISSRKRVSVIRIIDPPAIPDKRIWPKRKQIVMVLTLAAFFWTSIVLMILERRARDRELEPV